MNISFVFIYRESDHKLVSKCCSKDVLTEFAKLTDSSSEEFAKCHNEIKKSLLSIYPAGEYDEFLDKHR